MNIKSTRRGFTLIELLVVILIIGILAAVALPQYNKAVEKSRATEALLHMNNIQKGLDMWVLVHGLPEGYVQFFGSEATGHDSLDIDISPEMNCLKNGTLCESHFFTYSAYCSQEEGCVVEIARCPGGDSSKDVEWSLYAVKSATTGEWSNHCYYYTDFPYGEKICAELSSLGWVPSEE